LEIGDYWRRSEVRREIYSSDFAVRRIGRMRVRVGWATKARTGEGHVSIGGRRRKGKMMVTSLRSFDQHANTRTLSNMPSRSPGTGSLSQLKNSD
jgi:hypothetical protein